MLVEVSDTPAPLFLLLSTSGHCLRQATEQGAFLFRVELPKSHLQLFFRPAFLLSFSRHCDLLLGEAGRKRCITFSLVKREMGSFWWPKCCHQQAQFVLQSSMFVLS